MVTSYGETSGFSALNTGELVLVNGGKGDSGSSSSDGFSVTGPTIGDTTIPAGVEIRDGNVLFEAQATSFYPPSVSVTCTVSVK